MLKHILIRLGILGFFPILVYSIVYKIIYPSDCCDTELLTILITFGICVVALVIGFIVDSIQLHRKQQQNKIKANFILLFILVIITILFISSFSFYAI